MANIRHLEFSFFRNGNLIATSRITPTPENPGISLTSTSSLTAFPSSTLEVTAPELNKHLFDFGRRDILAVSTINDGDEFSNLMFKGEFNGKKISIEKKTNTATVSCDLVHSFYMTTFLEFSDEQFFKDLTVGSLIREIIEKSDCQASIKISKDSEQKKINGRILRGNLFRTIKEICHINDLCLNFGSDNSLSVESRREMLRRIHGSNPVQINADDVISYETSEGSALMSKRV